MNFVIIKDAFYKNFGKYLRESVSEFQPLSGEDEVYLLLNEFYDFIMQNIKNTKIAKECWQFINLAIEKGGSRTEDVIVTELFWCIYDEQSLKDEARLNLSESALKVFEREYENYKIYKSKVASQNANKAS